MEHDGKCITVFSAPNYCDQVREPPPPPHHYLSVFLRGLHSCGSSLAAPKSLKGVPGKYRRNRSVFVSCMEKTVKQDGHVEGERARGGGRSAAGPRGVPSSVMRLLGVCSRAPPCGHACLTAPLQNTRRKKYSRKKNPCARARIASRSAERDDPGARVYGAEQRRRRAGGRRSSSLAVAAVVSSGGGRPQIPHPEHPARPGAP